MLYPLQVIAVNDQLKCTGLRTGLQYSTSINITQGKKFSVKIDYNYGWACEKYRNEEEMETQEDYPAAEKSW